jgi:AraC family transcriptional regulator of adaptative response / DNA-3-methyladenine glycosylase II
VETVTPLQYRRNLPNGTLEVSPINGRDALQLRLEVADNQQLMKTVTQVRRMFDLDANPVEIANALQQDAALGKLSRQSPGARSPGHWSLYESAVRAIVGQQVSTVAARTVLSRLAHACHDSRSGPVPFPAAAQIAALTDNHFPMPGRRRDTLREVCAHYSDNEASLTADALATFRGIGPWTVAMVAIRGAGDPDIFPEGDLGLQRAWEALGGNKKELNAAASSWRPWRAYAANLLWRSLSA